MAELLQLFIWIPLAGFLLSLFLPRKNEFLISITAISTVGIYALMFVIFIIVWMISGYATLNAKHVTLFTADSIEIFIDFYFDRITAVFAGVGSIVAFLVFVFSRYYIHREEGFKRFFNTMLLFFLGYNLIIFSGNFETLFVGWEILGICSFLLIAFYRDRYLPVKNGLKVISVFRLGDICLILALWMSHHLWHENIMFVKLQDVAAIQGMLQQHYSLVFFISFMILLAAIIKSAQLPFSSWLPRAMEGPTSSSAIFYGSLSVHVGVFLLLRTFPFWESITLIKSLIIGFGLITSLIATGIASVQPTVKTQIAYSSVAQIGIIFIEIALGFHVLALIHFAGNAFLRTYQLLMSPSVLNYLIHDQFYHFVPGGKRSPAFKKIAYSLYILNVKEWNLDSLLFQFLWSPVKWAGKKLKFFSGTFAVVLVMIAGAYGLYAFFSNEDTSLNNYLPYLFSLLALVVIIRAFTERREPTQSWLLIFASQFFTAFSIALNSSFEFNQIVLYLSGGVVSGVLGYICLRKIKSLEPNVTLNKFHGHVYEHPRLALIFLLSCLGVVAFPITPSFIGIDVLLTHIHEDQVPLILITAVCLIFIEISVLRIYARVFLGQHTKAYHPMAYRSS